MLIVTGGVFERAIWLWPAGPSTSSWNSEPGQPLVKKRSVWPSAVAPGSAGVSLTAVSVPVPNATGWPVAASSVRLNTVKLSDLSAAEMAAGVVGAAPGATVVVWPAASVTVVPFAVTAITPDQSSMTTSVWPPCWMM